MKEYYFDIEDAVKYGVDEAIMLHNLKFWIAKNKANGDEQHDGKTWTYNSQDAFTRLFPFWSHRQIERIIKSLIDKGAIVKGNYNKKKFDRTIWYALADETALLPISRNGEMHLTKPCNGFHETVKPIPYNNLNIYKDIVEKVINHLNDKAGKKFRTTIQKNQRCIIARVKEGFSLNDFFKVINWKVEQWQNDAHMSRYIRPETLFGTKFEGYLNEIPNEKPKVHYYRDQNQPADGNALTDEQRKEQVKKFKERMGL